MFINHLSSSINRQNGSEVASQLCLFPINGEMVQLAQSNQSARRDGSAMKRQWGNAIGDKNLLEAVSHTFSAACEAVWNSDYEAAFRCQMDAYNAVLEAFSDKETATTWIIPILVRISNDLRMCAERADKAKFDVNHTLLRESLSSLTKGFTVVAKDRTPVKQPNSKKLAIFSVTNVLFKVYFKVNTLQLCGKLINVVEGPGGIMDNLPLFPICDVAMYKYYIGRLKMLEDKYEDAREALRFALKYCPRSCIKNRQQILANLVPVEMCLGVMPKDQIATVYGLHELVAMGKAAIKGDIKTFEYLLERHQSSFVRIGVYLVLEQVKTIVYRNLFKRMALITDNSRLNLHVVDLVMRWLHETVDLDEIECILANLVYQNKVKGYISHKMRMLVISKTDPFPTGAVVKKARQTYN